MHSRSSAHPNYKFVDLNRTFHELSSRNDWDDETDFSQFFGRGSRLHWTDLIKEYRLIILSEAGSGKTAEIRHVTHLLKEQGKQAFFLRLEHIPRDFEDAFEIGSHEEFEKWLASGEEGWLLLDSVDEARLRSPGDFELAIRKLGGKVRSVMDRTHVIITGRTSAWRPRTDLAHCMLHLPFTASAVSEQSSRDTDAAEDVATQGQGASSSFFKIVALDDLTSDQVATFVKARGITNSKAFLDSVDRADAWSFTSRPQDLEELTEFWADKNRIGTRLELMRNSIDRRLMERDQTRADARPLSIERVRQGARLLAAATTLTQDPTIRVPDGADNKKGIPVKDILSDWDEKDQSILLSRPIFDEAIYGTVRFHHRSVREYLTAEWFSELLKQEASRRTIEGLFFRNQYGIDIVVPSMRPVLPWLSILDERVRERVRKVAPEIILEGGDPSQLPLEIRRQILHEVCERICNDPANRSMHDYAAVQRFSSTDLTKDVKELLRKYTSNDELTAFLLRMVWIGQLDGALPEAMQIALTPDAERYKRINAIRAVYAIGSPNDKENIRQAFLAEPGALNREWFSELLEDSASTTNTVIWILACLERLNQEKPHSVDHASDKLRDFSTSTSIELLPQLVTGLNHLLSSPPLVEQRHCEVSDRFQWLIVPACEAIRQLLLARHPAALMPDALSILHKFPTILNYGIRHLNDFKGDLAILVPSWPDINRTLFWFGVQKSREALDRRRGERLTDYWQASIFGVLWRFDMGDFDYISGEISRQPFIDDKLVALSLAFKLYKEAGRPRTWRNRLKALAKDQNELAERLRTYLKPPAQDNQARKWKQEEIKWKKRHEEDRRKQEQHHEEWASYLCKKLPDLRFSILKNPGTLINPLVYLFEQARESNSASGRWTEYNWKTLIPKYGEDIARFYRDSAVSFWRHYEPELRSEGAAINQTPIAVIFGLVGLEIEAIECLDWPMLLRSEEVENACKFASFELNGFPTWFPKLFGCYPCIVGNFLLQEIQYELSIDNPDTDINYILNDVSWSGQWSWNFISPQLYQLVSARDPRNISNLRKLLKIIQGSNLSDDIIAKLALQKCCSVRKLDHLAIWYAVWTGVDPQPAITAFEQRINQIANARNKTQFAMNFVTYLLDTHWSDGASSRGAFKTPKHLQSLYLLMHQYIRSQEDIDRANGGVYSPGLRDHAQDARNSLFSLLKQIQGREAFNAIMDIARSHPESEYRPWMLSHAKLKAVQDGDLPPWQPQQVREFHEHQDRTPHNHMELTELAFSRLLDLKDDLENGDSSIAGILKNVSQETEIRKYIGRELRGRAFGRYSIPQEEELADAKRPDLRFHGTGFDGPVPIELKLADNWSGPALFERLRNQLCRDYLRDTRSTSGLFVLVYRGEKARWELPNSTNHVDFTGLVSSLQSYWLDIARDFPKIDDIRIIGIDLTKRLR